MRILVEKSRRTLSVTDQGQTVFVCSIVVVKSISKVGIFLYFCKKYAGTNGMNCAGFDIEYIIPPDRNLLQMFFQRILMQALKEQCFIHGMIKTINQVGIRCGIQYIPHFRFAQRSVFVSSSIGIIGMYLYGKFFPGINQFYQNWQCDFVVAVNVLHNGCRVCAQIFRVYV